MPLAWSYSRTSSVRQAQADRSGMDRQAAALARWLTEHPDYVLQEALIDVGVSAGKGKNRRTGALSRFIEGGRSGVVPRGSCLVVESMSRFSREVATTTFRTLLNDVWGAGLAISFTTDGVVLDEELIVREDHRLHAILGAIGQARREWEERSRRAEGAAVAARRRQDEGIRTPGPVPWWIARDASGALLRASDGALVLDPVAVTTIRRAVDLAINGFGSTTIADKLNAEGFPPPPTTRHRNQYGLAGRGWGSTRVATMLRHQALTGVLHRKGAQSLPGYYPAVLTPEEWCRLRASMEARDSLSGALRGGGTKVHNLFQTVVRCGDCGGPMGFHAPSRRAAPEHPGFLACRNGSRSTHPCGNRGHLRYDEIEAHCLTRLGTTDWEALLRRPEDDQDRHQLEQQVAQLGSDHARLQARLQGAERRAEILFEVANEERLATAERVVGRLRREVALAAEQLAEAAHRLGVIRSRPTAQEAAAEITARVREFWSGLATASPEERLSFNRWILARQIEFRIGAKRPHGGDRQVELRVGGRYIGIAPLAGPARQWAREQGMVDPTLAIAEQLPDGTTALVLIERTPGPPPPPRGLLELSDGGHVLVLNPSCPAADAEPPDEWPWSALAIPGLASAGGAAMPAEG